MDERDLSPLGRAAMKFFPGSPFRREIAEYVSNLERALERIASDQLDHDEILTISLSATGLDVPDGLDEGDVVLELIDELTMALREIVREANPKLFADRRLRWIRVSFE